MSRYGYGECSFCRLGVAITKDGKARRHGFVRVKRGYIRTAFPEIKGGHTAYPCKGSAQPTRFTYFVKQSS